MPSYNQISIVGHLGKDPEIRYMPSTGDAVCNFSVATSRKRGDKKITTWFKVAVWGKQAENCNQYLHKGALVNVFGELYQEEWTSKDGQKGTSLIIDARDVKFLKTDKDDVEELASDNNQQESELANQSTSQPDGDIPF